MSIILPLLSKLLGDEVLKRRIDIENYTFYIVFKDKEKGVSSFVVFAEDEGSAINTVRSKSMSCEILSVWPFKKIKDLQSIIDSNKYKEFLIGFVEEFDYLICFEEAKNKEDESDPFEGCEYVMVSYIEAAEFLKLFLQVFMFKIEHDSVEAESFERFLSSYLK